MKKKYMILVNAEEAALSFYFPRRVLLCVKEFIQMAMNVRSCRISCSLIFPYGHIAQLLFTCIYAHY